MSNRKISLPVIRRLPRYYRYVSHMAQEGVETVSSSTLAEMMGSTASQVRQDFNCFGGFGQQGIGYSVRLLAAELEKLLLGDTPLDTVLIGAGRLGGAIATFLQNGFLGCRLTAVFDKSAAVIGTQLAGLAVQDVALLKAYCAQHAPKAAVLCVPAAGAEELAAMLPELGVTGFWNFSNYDLQLDNTALVVENVHLGDSFMSLGYLVRSRS